MNQNLTLGQRAKGAASYAWREGTVYIILVFLIAMFSFVNPLFFSAKNIYNLITQSSYYIIAGIGIAFVMIGGGIDLSVGYEMAMVSTTSAIFMQQYMAAHGGDCPVWFILVIFAWAIALGFLMGMLNGVICAKLGLFPLIATIATSEVFKGISFTITNSKTFSGMPEAFRAIYKAKFLNIPLDVYLAVACILLA